MAGGMRHGLGFPDDHHRADTHHYSYSSSSKGPRSSPPLLVTKNHLTTENEPRNFYAPLLNRLDDSDPEYREDDNYTLSGGTIDPNTSYSGGWYKKCMQDGMDQRLASMRIDDAPRGSGIGYKTSDNKDTPRSSKSYAEVVKTSSPVIGSPQPTNQAPTRPKSPKKTSRGTRKLQAQPLPEYTVESSPQTLSHSVEKYGKAINNVPSSRGHNHAADHRATSSSYNRPVVRGVTLDENTLHIAHQRQSANPNNIYSEPYTNHVAASSIHRGQKVVVRAKSAGQLSYFKGIGGWVGSGPCNNDPSHELPRIVATTSAEYQKLLSLDKIVQCATGNAKATGSNKNVVQFPKTPAGRQTSSRGNRNTGKRNNPKRHDGEGSDDGSDGDENNLQGPNSNPGPSTPKKWYPCPFHKHDPLHYNTNEITRKRYTTCAGKWDDIARLKEHLYRVHCEPYMCGICQLELKNRIQLVAHQEVGSCFANPARNREAKEIPPDVQDELRKRPKHGMTNDERWYEIWDLLFPGTEQSLSPLSDVQEVESIHENLDQQMQDLFRTRLSNSLEGLGISGAWKNQIIAIAVEQEKACRHELLSEFQKKDLPTPPSSEEGESPNPAGTFAASQQGSMAPEQPSQTCFPHETEDISMIVSPTSINYNQLQHCLPQPSFFTQPATPPYSHQGLGPSTQTFSTSSRSDSAYHSNSTLSGVSDDGRYINPAVFLTPTPNAQHTRRNPPSSRNRRENTADTSRNANTQMF